MHLLTALTYRPFALLWSGQTVSRLGDSLYRVALAWWVLEQTGSAAVMGTVLICSFTPMLLFLLIGGIAVDRFPRVRLMLGSDALRAVVIGTVAALAATHSLAIWHIYVASIVFGFVDAFFQPAYVALVPDLTPAPALPSANALTSLSGQITGVAGPALGAGIVALGGTPVAFALDALSFLLSAACLLPLLGVRVPRAAVTEATNVWQDLRGGLAAVTASPWLWITIALAAFSNITLSAPVAVALPFLVRDSLHAGVDVLGLLYSSNAVGAIGAALWIGMRRQRRRGLRAYGAWAISGLALVGFGLSLPVPVMVVLAALNGAMLMVFGLIWTHTLQELVPRDLLGRVSSVDILGSFALLPVGFGIAGWATDHWGAPLVFIIGGALTTILIALGLAHPAIRRLD
ncbi:MAG: MFS transporter [Chloroflexota bacterium]|nr:MFS transporter [Chloroflexota bacterium]